MMRVVDSMRSKPRMHQGPSKLLYFPESFKCLSEGVVRKVARNPINFQAHLSLVGSRPKHGLPFTTSSFAPRSFRFGSRSLQVIIRQVVHLVRGEGKGILEQAERSKL